MRSLFVHHGLCPSGLKKFLTTPPPFAKLLNLRFISESKEEETTGEVAGKARSTAEEFLRQAKEKSDEISQSAKETLEEAKEAVAGESEEEKEKFKEKVEKGNYDKMGRD